MKHLMTVTRGINTLPMAMELKRQPQLWNKNPERTADANSPHHQVDDIWVRYAGSYAEGSQSHESRWLPAAELLPAVKQNCRAVMGLVGGDALGGVLITRIPPGCRVLPHIDRGWHAEHYDKFLLQIEAHPQQSFCYEDGQHISAVGDLFWFHNQESHWVINDSPVERISLIICVQLEKPFNGGVLCLGA